MTQFLLANFGQALLETAVDADDTTFIIDAELSTRFPEPSSGQAFALVVWDGAGEPEIVYCTNNSGTGILLVQRGQEGSTPRAWLAGTQLRLFLTSGTISLLLQTGFVEGNRASQPQAEAGSSNSVLMTPQSATWFFNERVSETGKDFIVLSSVEEMRTFLGWATASFSGTGLETDFTLPSADWDTPFTRVYVDEEFQTSGYTITGALLEFDTPPASGTDNIVVVFGQNFAFSVSFPGNNTVSEDAIIDGAVTEDKVASNAISTAKIASKAVTLAKMQDITGPGLLGRLSGTGAPQVITPTPEDLGFGSRVFETGDTKSALRTSVPTGWIRAAGGTIGNASSGASNRANADTEALFTLWWNEFDNTTLPIYTSGGSATSRGASAAADFAANKRLQVFDPRGRFFRFWDNGRGIDSGRAIGTEQGELVGPHSHTASASADGAHAHTVTMNANARFGANASGSTELDFGSGDSIKGSGTRAMSVSTEGSHTHTITVASNGTLENRPSNFSLPLFVKL